MQKRFTEEQVIGILRGSADEAIFESANFQTRCGGPCVLTNVYW